MTRYEQIAQEIARSIEQGVLRPGERIASVRRTSTQQRVNAGTVLRAFGELEARGLIEARPQSGYYVRARALGLAPEPATSAPQPRSTDVDVSNLVFKVLDAMKHPDIVPLGSAFPSPELFPLEQLNRAAARAARHLDPWSSVTDLPPGNPELRRQIALRYLQSGCSISPDEIVITGGALEAINLCLQVVTMRGDCVAIETPTFYPTLQAIERLQLKAVEIATSPRDGIDLASLQHAIKTLPIKACVFITTFQNPLGSCMPDEKKAELAALLARHKIPLIEDDVYAELYFGGTQPRPTKAYDRAGWVMHCGSFAKCLAPGYRIGWAAPGQFKTAVERLKFMTSLSTASLPQVAIADYVKHGGYERHLRRLRHALSSQMNDMTKSIGEYFPASCKVTRPNGGYVLWVELPKSIDALKLHQLALAENISIVPGPIFSAQRKYKNFIRLNSGHPWSQRMEDAIRTLGGLIVLAGKDP